MAENGPIRMYQTPKILSSFLGEFPFPPMFRLSSRRGDGFVARLVSRQTLRLFLMYKTSYYLTLPRRDVASRQMRNGVLSIQIENPQMHIDNHSRNLLASFPCEITDGLK